MPKACNQCAFLQVQAFIAVLNDDLPEAMVILNRPVDGVYPSDLNDLADACEKLRKIATAPGMVAAAKRRAANA